MCQSDTSHHKSKIYLAPLALATASALSWSTGLDDDIQNWRLKSLPDFHNTLDDPMQFMAYGLVHVLPVFGLKTKHNFKTRSFLAGKSALLAMGTTYILKYSINRTRPSGASHAFPSGHTGFAFVGAELFYQEYKDRYPVLAYLGYAIGAQVAVFRVMNNQHWFSDVLAASAVGILSTKLVYALHQHKFSNNSWKKKKFSFFPDPINKGLVLSFRF